jgi:hypothetical protein
MSAAVFKRSLPFTISSVSKRRSLVPQQKLLYNHIKMASTTKDAGKPPFPPFTLETAQIKVKAAQDLWNTK